MLRPGHRARAHQRRRCHRPAHAGPAGRRRRRRFPHPSRLAERLAGPALRAEQRLAGVDAPSSTSPCGGCSPTPRPRSTPSPSTPPPSSPCATSTASSASPVRMPLDRLAQASRRGRDVARVVPARRRPARPRRGTTRATCSRTRSATVAPEPTARPLTRVVVFLPQSLGPLEIELVARPRRPRVGAGRCSASPATRRRSRLVEAAAERCRRTPIAIAGRASTRRHRGRVGHRCRRGGPPRRPDGGRRRPATARRSARDGVLWPTDRPYARLVEHHLDAGRHRCGTGAPARRSASASSRDSCSTCSTSTAAACAAAICSTCSPTFRCAIAPASRLPSRPGSASAATPASSRTTNGSRGCGRTPHGNVVGRGPPRRRRACVETPVVQSRRRRRRVAGRRSSPISATDLGRPGATPAWSEWADWAVAPDRTTGIGTATLQHLDEAEFQAWEHTTPGARSPAPSRRGRRAGDAERVPVRVRRRVRRRPRPARPDRRRCHDRVAGRCRRARPPTRDRARRRRRPDAGATLGRPADRRRRPRWPPVCHPSDSVTARTHRQLLGVLDSAAAS